MYNDSRSDSLSTPYQSLNLPFNCQDCIFSSPTLRFSSSCSAPGMWAGREEWIRRRHLHCMIGSLFVKACYQRKNIKTYASSSLSTWSGIWSLISGFWDGSSCVFVPSTVSSGAWLCQSDKEWYESVVLSLDLVYTYTTEGCSRSSVSTGGILSLQICE